MSRATKWEVLGVQKRWKDGAYGWAEEENLDPRRRWAWHLTKGGKEGYDFDGTAPTLEVAVQRILAARREALCAR